jgi:hypothetical protein
MRVLDATDTDDEALISPRLRLDLLVLGVIFALLCVVAYYEYGLNLPNLIFDIVKSTLDPDIPTPADDDSS